MKSFKLKIIFSAICFLICSCSVFANQAEELMEQANDFYQKQEYKKAKTIYQGLVDSGYTGTSLYYNLGNTYYREGKIGFAILNYERALRLSPGDDDVQHNLALANSKTIDRIDTLPKFFIFQWWEGLLALFSLKGWTYAAFIFYILLLITIGIYFFAKKPEQQKYSFFGGIISLILVIITSVLLVVKLNREVNIKNGIVIEQTAIAKVSPDEKSSDAFVIHEGLKVRFEDNVDNWIKIKLNDGKVGWLPKNEVRII